MRKFYRDDKNELYDLKQDPLELHNLEGEAAYKYLENELKDELFKWYLGKKLFV